MGHEDDDQRGVLEPVGSNHWVGTRLKPNQAVEKEMSLRCKRFRQDR